LVYERQAGNAVPLEVELMEYFYGGGGSSDPNFIYRFEVAKVTDDMWKWCEQYPLTGPFERWHVKHFMHTNANPIITFESRKAAYLFSIAYSEYIIENKSLYDLVEPKHQ
jgi:hypothetical protein